MDDNARLFELKLWKNLKSSVNKQLKPLVSAI